MEQKITVKREVGIVIPTDRLVTDFFTIRKHTTPQISETFSGIMEDAFSVISTDEGLLGFSVRKKEVYTPNEIGMAILRNDEGVVAYWEAMRFVAHNYFDPDTMSEPLHPETPDDGFKKCIVPLDGYVGDLICSLEGNAGVAYIGNFHAFDADGNDLGVLVYDGDPNSKIQVRDGGGNVVRSGRIMTIPEGAATLRFNWNWKYLSSEFTELMVTHGDSISGTYVPYGDGWETITDTAESCVLPSGSVYDYFVVTNNVE